MKDTTTSDNTQTNRKPTYKDYQNFLQNYDDQQTKTNGLVISPASSSSSLQSEKAENDVSMPKAYNEYLQSYGNRKFGSVRMKNEKVLEGIQKFNDQIDGDVKKNEKKIVRSELVININPVNVKSPINKSPEIRVSQISPKPVDKSTVPDHMIYAKSAVLEELLSNSPTLKKPSNTTGNIYKRLEQFTLQKESSPSSKLPPKLPSSPSPNIPSSMMLPPKLPSSPSPNIPPSMMFPPKLPSSPSPNIPSSINIPPPPPKIFPPSLPTSPTPTRVQVQLKKSVSNGPMSPKPPIPQKTFLNSPEAMNVFIPPPPPLQFNTLPKNGFHQNGNNQKMLSNTQTVVPVVDGNAEVNKNDPNVKKLIYNTYRGMLGAYNNKANNMVSTLPRNFVVQDQGVGKQLESITPQGPAIPQGVSRQASDRRVEPPLVVQNAMLTKDKKPFTYTPGGIDLSEISSPRLARRVERNAMAPGVAEVQRTSPPRGYTGPPLPPSALAAMQPALPVQVFPSGPPPPPPIPAGGPAPPPPPPPMDALPTKSFATNDGVFERPDMTKIIPENPMALLKKTPRMPRPVSDGIQYGGTQEPSMGGPRSMEYSQPPMMAQMNQQRPMEPRPMEPRPMEQRAMEPRLMEPVQPPPLVQMVQQRQMESAQPEMKTSTAQLGTLYIPPVENQNQKRIATPPVIERPVQTPPTPQRTVPQSPGSPQSPIATLTKAPRPWQNQKPPSQDVPAWVQRSQSPPETPQRKSQSPPGYVVTTPKTPNTPNFSSQQERSFPKGNQSPGIQGNVIGRVIIPVQMDGSTPNVDAVYVTQPIVLQHPGNRADGDQQKIAREQQMRIQQEQQMKQQEEQRRIQQEQQMRQQEQQRMLQEQQMRQQEQQRMMQEQQLRQQQMQQQKQLQQQQQMQQQNSQKTEPKNVRIIPIQIEGGSTGSNTNGNVQRQDSNRFGNSSPGTATPGTARVFNRQPSWSQSGPTQSNSFKVIQKLTNTDGDDDEDEDPSEHPPRNSQHFQQQQVPVEQTRKMVLNDGDRELMNKVKQVFIEKDEENPRYRGGHIPSRIFKILDASGVDQEIYLHRETDPRYRGAAIPSKAFRLLQSMTDSGSAVAPVPKSSQSQNVGNSSNNVRTIPVQIEGSSSNYVPPSEQTVEEPKKYTGGKIPSRSFKMLQAMTGDPCAAPHQDSQFFGYAPRFPPQYFPPYCPPYFVPPPYSRQFSMSPNPREWSPSKNKSARTTPVHFSSNKTNRRSFYDDENDFYEQEKHFYENKKSRSSSLPRKTPPKNSFWSDSEYEDDEERYFRERNQRRINDRRSPYGFWDPYYMYYYPQQVYSYHMYNNNYGYHDDFSDDFDEENDKNEENVKSNFESEVESFSENSSCNVTQKNSVGYSDEEYEVSEEECEENESKSEETSVRTEEIPHELSVIFEESERSDFIMKDSSSETLAVEEIVEEENYIENGRLQSEKNQKERFEAERFQNARINEEIQFPEEKVQGNWFLKENVKDGRFQRDKLQEQRLPKETSTNGRFPEETRCFKENWEDGHFQAEKHNEERFKEEKPEEKRFLKENFDNGRFTEETLQRKGFLKENLEARRFQDARINEGTLKENRFMKENVEDGRFQEERIQRNRFLQENVKNGRFQEEKLQEEKILNERSANGRFPEEKLKENRCFKENWENEKFQAEKLQEERFKKEKPREEGFLKEILKDNRYLKENVEESRLNEENFKENRPKNEKFQSEFQEEKNEKSEEDKITPKEKLSDEKSSKTIEKHDKDWWSEIKPSNDDEIYLKSPKKYEEITEEVDFWKTILQEDKVKIPEFRKNQEVIVENHEKAGTITEENDKEIFEDKFEEKSENVSVNAKDHKYTVNKSQCKETFNLKPKNEENSEENYVRSSNEQSENYEYQKDDLKFLINSEKNVDNTDFRIKDGASIYHGNLSVSSKKKIFKESVDHPKIDKNIKTIKKEGISIEKEDSSSEIVKKTTVCSIIIDDEKENEEEKEEEKEELKIPSIKERIAALKVASEKAKEFKMVQDKVDKVNKIKEKIQNEKKIEQKIKNENQNQNEKIDEDSSDSEEEIDSGVTSDISRHISDTEEYSELNKMSKYQRAATHSRLFKLLQEECESEDLQESEAIRKDEKNQKNLQKRKESLTLDLKPEEEGFNSSGIDSLTPPVNDKLVKELVRSLLKGKRGEAFREMPLEKLHNAAYRILQEEIFDSNESKSSTAIQTPQDFYNNDDGCWSNEKSEKNDKFSYSNLTPNVNSNPLIRFNHIRSKPETNTS